MDWQQYIPEPVLSVAAVETATGGVSVERQPGQRPAQYRKRRLSHLQRVVEQYGHRTESTGEGPGRPRYVAAYLGRNENVRL